MAELLTQSKYPDLIVFSQIWITSVEGNNFQLPDYSNLFTKCNVEYRAEGIALYFCKLSINIEEFFISSFVTADKKVNFKGLGLNLAL